MKKNNKKTAARLSAPAPHSSQGIGMSSTPQVQTVVILPVDEFYRMKEEFICEVRNLGTGIAGAPVAIKEVMTAKEAAEYLGISVKHLMELRRQKKIGCSQDGRVIRFHRSHVLEYLEAHSVSQR